MAVDKDDADTDDDADDNADDDAEGDVYLNMLHQVPRVREAKRAVAALQVWWRRLVRANLETKIMIMDFTFSGLK